ncbi:MAG: hypothetical protein U5L45_11555 [Saprospiraceae bacterium]|nr:hypothetical protein [Saprospiraceae bacterium]
MTETKDYSKLTIEELTAEEKKIKKSELYSAFGIGFLGAVMVYGVVKGGFGFLYIAIPLFFIAGIVRNSQKVKQDLKQIQSEIENKKQ